ncbi:MAG: hypothetical protein FWG65_10625 [Turicibacter sp.]|nr:hypothetical protein [Turicibacter sp.]
MNDFMEYKGYYGSIEYYAEDSIFYGKVVNTSWLILYEGEDLAALKFDFEDAIDDCLLMCEQRNEPPIPIKPERMQEFIAEKLSEQQNLPTTQLDQSQQPQLQPV